jgi:hypothetical protein
VSPSPISSDCIALSPLHSMLSPYPRTFLYRLLLASVMLTSPAGSHPASPVRLRLAFTRMRPSLCWCGMCALCACLHSIKLNSGFPHSIPQITPHPTDPHVHAPLPS